MTETHSSVQQTATSFADFAVNPAIVEALANAGIVAPFPIQSMTLPVALAGHDIIGQAKTGTGKTLGFGVPALHRTVSPGEPGWDEYEAKGKPQALVVAPTRELAVQVAGDFATASKLRTTRIAQIYGGRAYEPQVEMLKRGVEVVVGTPGRMIDLLNQGHLDLRYVRTVVLDEADEMLDLGFLPDVEKLLAATPASRHTMLFSATMPGAVVALARRYMTQPTHIRAADPDDDSKTVKAIKQVVYQAHAMNKVEMLSRILQAAGRGRTIVFARTKRTAAKVSDELRERGFAAGALHGDLGQGAREQALRAFRAGKIDILVATDVAARGIDVDDVTHVVNYQCPEDEKTYLHRTGRTGRAGKTGVAVTFVDWDELPRWGLIDKALDLGYPEPLETFHNSTHLFEDLDIQVGTGGILPRDQRTLAGLDAETLEDLGETGKKPASRDSGSRGGGRDSAPRGGGRDSGARDGGRGGSRSDAPRTPRDGDRGRGRGGRDGSGNGGSGKSSGAQGGAAGSGGGATRPAGDGSAPREPRTPREPSNAGAPRRNRNRSRRSGGADGAAQPNE